MEAFTIQEDMVCAFTCIDLSLKKQHCFAKAFASFYKSSIWFLCCQDLTVNCIVVFSWTLMTCQIFTTEDKAPGPRSLCSKTMQ